MKEHKSLNDIIKYRKEKLEIIKDYGHNPFAYNYKKTHLIKDVITKKEEINNQDTISIAGRIISFRKMGKASFLHIQDISGKIQLYVKNDLLPANIYDQIVRNLDLGDIIGCEGNIFITKVGELSIRVNNLFILSKNLRPLPNLKEKEGENFNSFEDKELRYRNRHLDLIANPDTKNIFIKRAKIISSIRQYMDGNEYIEVETPVLQPIYGGASARPFKTFHNTLDETLYLRIADELYLKRLIIGGFEKVYELAKDFRNEGMDRSHNPEFTMLEFYQAYVDVYYMMDYTENLLKHIANVINEDQFIINGAEINLSKPFERISMSDLFKKYLDINIIDKSTKELIQFAKTKKIDVRSLNNYGQALDKIFGDLIEPKLIKPTFVYDYPKAISPLAKSLRSGEENIVERFELFIGGMEFANSFSELNDPIEQRNRLEEQMQLNREGDEEAHVLDENFLQAMESGMPPTGGVGIGIDRLVMLFTNQNSIKDVILFPAMRKE